VRIDIPIEVIDDQRARAMACINAWLRRDKEGFDAAAGSDAEAGRAAAGPDLGIVQRIGSADQSSAASPRGGWLA
jgi:hypothetical protein